jgi:hypothetical protein
MENVLLRKLRMYNSSNTVLQSYGTVWANSVPFVSSVNLLVDCLDKIEEKDHDQKSTKAYTKEKKQVYVKMLDVALVVCSAGSAYAGVINSDKTKEDFGFTKSSLKEGNEKEIYKRCQKIGEDAVLITDKLVDYNVSAPIIKELTDAVVEFFKLMDVSRNVRQKSKSSKEEMKALYDECDRILNNIIDKMMLTYKSSHADFFLEYTNSRVIGGWSRKDDDEKEETQEPII